MSVSASQEQRLGARLEPSAGPSHHEGPLARTISSRMLLLFVIGDVLGAGIYALVGEVGGRVGGAVWAAVALVMLLAVFTAFAYPDLVTKYPHAPGAALFVNNAFRRPFLKFLAPFAVTYSV